MVEIILFIFLLFILVFLGLKLRVEILDYDNIKIKNNGFRIKFKVYVFIVKLFEITFTETGVKYLKSKKEHKYKLKTMEFISILLDKDNNSILNIISYDNFKDLNIKLKEFNLYLKIGVLEDIITSFVITIISTVLSIFIGKKVHLLNKDKIYYKVEPAFDELYFNLKLNLKFEIYNFSIYKFLLRNRNELKELHLVISEFSKNKIEIKENADDIDSDNKTHTKLKESSI